MTCGPCAAAPSRPPAGVRTLPFSGAWAAAVWILLAFGAPAVAGDVPDGVRDEPPAGDPARSPALCRPPWPFGRLGGEMDAMLKLAEGLSDTPSRRRAAKAWGRLSSEAEAAWGPGDPRTLAALSREIRSLADSGEGDRFGRETAERARDGLAAALGSGSPETLYASQTVATLMLARGEAEGGAALLGELAEFSAREIGSSHPLTLSIRRSLSGARRALRREPAERARGPEDPGGSRREAAASAGPGARGGRERP